MRRVGEERERVRDRRDGETEMRGEKRERERERRQ